MEKFGIFELLDALSALTEGQSAVPKADDPAFSAPAYPAPVQDPPPPPSGRDALGGLLARHEAISRKAKKE